MWAIARGAFFALGLTVLLVGVGVGVVVAAPTFPELSGRVVDQAQMLSGQAQQQITELSQGHENATGNQVVVVTLAELQGYSIEEFGFQLGRAWGIGQKDQNNGVLLIIAKAERKVRIEVGYGLEGGLTDAISSNIINTVITPNFKLAQFDAGVVQATQAIIEALGGQYEMRQPAQGRDQETSDEWKIFAFIIFFLFLRGVVGRGGFWSGLFAGSIAGASRGRGHRGGGGFSGGFGGGGFSGGGGGFGGGGASGGW